MRLALGGRTARPKIRDYRKWKIHLVVPHSGTRHHGYDDVLLEDRKVTREQIEHALKYSRYNIDIGAHEYPSLKLGISKDPTHCPQ